VFYLDPKVSWTHGATSGASIAREIVDPNVRIDVPTLSGRLLSVLRVDPNAHLVRSAA
jgi:hypothetical protein